jgi:uncharacterized protein YqhQ
MTVFILIIFVISVFCMVVNKITVLWNIIYHIVCSTADKVLLLFYSEDSGSRFVSIVGLCLQNYITANPRRSYVLVIIFIN